LNRTISLPFLPIILLILLLLSANNSPGTELDMTRFYAIAEKCAPSIHKDTVSALVRVESGYNPYAIGVVGGRLSRQPRNIQEALSVVDQLEDNGFNYSLGLSQINKYNLPKLGLDIRKIFDPCTNLRAGQTMLSECHARAKAGGMDGQESVKAALSCYYSGSFTTGLKDGYVQAVLSHALKEEGPIRIIKTERPTRDRQVRMRKTSQAVPKEEARRSDSAMVF
jgi:type IV secretion system protein VirB1